MSFYAEHYIKVAKIIREVPPVYGLAVVSKTDLIMAFAEMFAEDNPKFNPGTFWDECQPLKEKKDGA